MAQKFFKYGEETDQLCAIVLMKRKRIVKVLRGDVMVVLFYEMLSQLVVSLFVRQSYSQVIIPIELYLSLQLCYQVSFIYVKTNLDFWSRSYCRQPFL